MEVKHFIPTQHVVRQLKDRKKKVEVPIIPNLVFIYATKSNAFSLTKDFGIKIYYVVDHVTRSILIVPEKQMRDFMFVLDLDTEEAILDNDLFQVGDRVQVVKGKFNGIEGELLSLSNRSYVVIRILDLVALKVKIPKSHLKKL